MQRRQYYCVVFFVLINANEGNFMSAHAPDMLVYGYFAIRKLFGKLEEFTACIAIGEYHRVIFEVKK